MNKFKLLLMLSISCSAFPQDEIDFFELSLEELIKIEIASTQKQTIYSSPSSVYVISSQQLKAMGIDDLQALLNFVPGFQSTRDVEQGTANRISARGRSSALSESVLVQINGERINDLYTGGISILNRMLDLGNVAHIEIIRGPGSALYGSNAFLGVVNIVTETGQNEINFSMKTNGSVESNISVSNQFDELQVLDIYLSGYKDRGDSYEITDLYGITDSVKDPSNGADLYIMYTHHNLKLKGRYMERELKDFLALGSIGNGVNNEQTEQWSFDIDYAGKITNQLDYNMSLYHSTDHWNTTALLIPKAVEIAPDFALDSDFIGGPHLSSQVNKASFNMSYTLNNSHLISMGTSFEVSKITDVYTSTTHNLFTLEEYGTSIDLTGEQSFNVKKSRQIFSLYIQDQWHINENWELTTGVRHDNYNDFGSSTSPRLAFVFKPQEKQSVKLMYGTAFRAPNFLELYDRNNYVDFGNVNLNAEEVETIELSWLSTLSHWHFEITAFNNSFKNLIRLDEPVEHPENPFFAPSFTNNSGISSRGVESEIQYKLTNHFNAKLLWNWFTKDSDINVSRNFGSLMFNYHNEQIQINLSAYFRGENNAILDQSGYAVWSLNTRYALMDDVKVSLNIKNLFDKAYKTQSIMYSGGVDNRGREIDLGIEYRW
jgi:outer membrane receptor for ferrienterochelin and colicin